jgi:hypothetical protein
MKILFFFIGSHGGSGTEFEIYNTNSGEWSTAILKKIQGAAIISVNTIYVAGGSVKCNGAYPNQAWKLEF